MPTKHILCIDGTWNASPSWNAPGSTNVAHLSQCIEIGGDQRVYYLSGLGTDDVSMSPKVEGFLERLNQRSKVPSFLVGWLTLFGVFLFRTTYRFLGGSTGYGIYWTIRRAYFYLASNYEPGDEIFIFGFSRGAYAARSLCGLLRRCGLARLPDAQPAANPRPDRKTSYHFFTTPDPVANRLNTKHADQAPELWRLTKEAMHLYRSRDVSRQETFNGQHCHPDCPVEVVGVFDTVRSLGFLDSSLNFLNPFHVDFHDTTPSPEVRHAYHALAIDEHRFAFRPTLWGTPASQDAQTVEEIWFAGDHADVGGGHYDVGLSSVSLSWMIDKARSHGLKLDDHETTRRLEPARRAPHRSRSGIWRLIPTYFRKIAADKKSRIHVSVQELVQDQQVSYKPENLRFPLEERYEVAP